MAKKTKKSGDKGSTVVLKKTKAHSEVLGKHMSSPSLLDGENSADYESFRRSCLHAVRPKDAIEEIWLQDVIDYSWEAQRLRRMKAPLIEAARREAVEILLKDYVDDWDFPGMKKWDIPEPFSKAWARHDEEITASVEAFFEERDLDRDTIMAVAVSLKLPDLERIDKLIASYDYRRDAALRELEKRRDILAKRAREFTDVMITDVDVEELEAAE